MKLIALLLINILYSLPGISQQVSLNDSISVNLPVKTERINKDQFASYVNKTFPKSKTAANYIPGRGERMDNKHFYKTGDVLITLVHGSRPKPVKDNYLLNLKDGLDAMHKKFSNNANYTSVIKTINNN